VSVTHQPSFVKSPISIQHHSYSTSCQHNLIFKFISGQKNRSPTRLGHIPQKTRLLLSTSNFIPFNPLMLDVLSTSPHLLVFPVPNVFHSSANSFSVSALRLSPVDGLSSLCNKSFFNSLNRVSSNATFSSSFHAFMFFITFFVLNCHQRSLF